MHDNDRTPEHQIRDLLAREEGHAYAYGGGTLLAILIIVILLIWLL